MTWNYNAAGPKRKELAAAVGAVLGLKPKYLGMPTAAYQIGGFTVTREGSLVFDDMADREGAGQVLAALAAAGFACAPQDGGEDASNVGLTVALPLDKVQIDNLNRILTAKGSLIKKALGIDATPVEAGHDTVSFPWFSELPKPDVAKAYTHLISALCEMSINQKRITAREKEIGNDKYAFRCFLLRLGFIGAEYKAERKILLRNLSGSSAFKNGGAEHEISQ